METSTIAEVRSSLRDDWEVGEWYHNPMMEMHGRVRAKYTKLCKVDLYKYTESSQLHFDELIMPDGEHVVLSVPLSQSNDQYEEQMEKIEFRKIRPAILGSKFGI